MKLSLLAFLFATVSARTISSHNAKKVISNARRLEDGGGDDAAEADEDEDEYAFLMNYKLKMRSCIPVKPSATPKTASTSSTLLYSVFVLITATATMRGPMAAVKDTVTTSLV
jgi:hypothetical protein